MRVCVCVCVCVSVCDVIVVCDHKCLCPFRKQHDHVVMMHTDKNTMRCRKVFLRQDPLQAILVIFRRSFLILFCFVFESSWKNMKNDTTFVRVCSGDHLGDARMLKKGTSLRRI